MKNAILLHGRPRKDEYYDGSQPSASNAHWFAWLQKQLMIHDIKADTPEVPFAFEPLWERWVKEVERFEIGPETILVGHSMGGGFWVRYLSEHKDHKVGKVVLVAPWIDVEQEAPNNFFQFELDENIAARTQGLAIFHSDDDAPEIQSSVKELRAKLTAITYREFQHYGHFCYEDMNTTEFPELLEECFN